MSFIFVAAFIMLSLFVGVVTTSMFEAQQDMAIKNALAELQVRLWSRAARLPPQPCPMPLEIAEPTPVCSNLCSCRKS